MKRDRWTEESLLALQAQLNETKLVCGIDEVGRGPLAGPVVACAIIMPKQEQILGVCDSKKCAEKKRERLYEQILEKAIACGLGWVDAACIDRINILEATRLAMKKAVENLRTKEGMAVVPDLLVIDALRIDSAIPQIDVIRGDDRIYEISCASIVAKVTRDRYMKSLDAQYPEYCFSKHKGYPTSLHRALLQEHGYLPLHRKSFLRRMEVEENPKYQEDRARCRD